MRKLPLTIVARSPYATPALAKTSAERGNSNLLPTANNTPTACFFVSSIRTPKENAKLKNRLSILLSMVGRIGQRLIVGCVPLVAVFHPDTFYRQAWKLAVDVYNLPTEFSTMIYLFQCVRRTEADYRYHKIYIQADSEQNARFQLHADYRPLPERPIARFQHFPTACLQAAEVVYAS